MSRLLQALLVSLSMVLSVAATASQQEPQAPQVQVTPKVLAKGLHYPWSMAELPEGGWLVTERPGNLVYLNPQGQRMHIPLDLPDLYATAQAGLFEVLLTPDFEQSRELVLSYSCGTEQANNTCVVKAKLSPPNAAGYALSALQNIFTALPKKEGAAHFGARMTWLGDGSLLVALGDGFVYREQAQNLQNHLGKIVRILRDGKVPEDNPFTHTQAPEVYSYGHRNVQGLVFDAERNKVWQHEHGPKGGDEINDIVKGGNYGWPMTTFGKDYTGALVSPYNDLPGVKAPLYQWTPSLAPAGLALYQGDLLVSHLAGKRLQRLRLVDGKWHLIAEYLVAQQQRLRAVMVAKDGRVLVLTDSNEGELWSLDLDIQQ
ncbi:MAG: PQQ-dependent sugar dehydrogenase [Pseudidiomarina maritima]|nr:PQQ-dependent sugar dehydrogenase [Pseudidiomarina maritima]